MTQHASPTVPVPVIRALRKLGHDIRDARRRRRIPVAILAERASISRTTLSRIEKGDPSASLGNYATVLFSLGMAERLADVADTNSFESLFIAPAIQIIVDHREWDVSCCLQNGLGFIQSSGKWFFQQHASTFCDYSRNYLDVQMVGQHDIDKVKIFMQEHVFGGCILLNAMRENPLHKLSIC